MNKTMLKKHTVDFIAHKKVKEPVEVSFQSKNGPVSFEATKKVLEEVEVNFKAKNKQ